MRAKMIAQVVLMMFASTASAQAPVLVIDPEVKLLEEAAESEQLVSSLTQFLGEHHGKAASNEWVFSDQLLQSAILLDELVGISEKGDSKDFYKPHLTNVIPLSKGQYFVQLSYIGVSAGIGVAAGIPVIKAHIELVAHKSKDKFLFSSPLARNTKDWKAQRIGNMTFHYRGVVDEAKAREYQRLTALFDGKLGAKPEAIAFYFVEDDLEAQQLFGLPYKLDYNGNSGSQGWRGLLEGQEIYLTDKAQFASFDPHDLWHNRLSKVKSRRAVNHAIDEGIATLYGGCWGLSWEEMFAAFRDKIDVAQGTDWLSLRAQKVIFETPGHRNPVDFMVTALFVKKVEASMGFAGVWELLDARDERAYFRALEKLMGITKENYNAKVWALIEAEIAEQAG